ncbi:MAG TPA: VWA domain-containing protein [Polyangiaceae bacterium]
MSFVAVLGLAVGLLVAAPYLAHRLRRRRAEERPFAAAHLVPPAPPRARRRSRLEDRGLFALRAASVVALAFLGASPLVRCSRLSLHREGGASVALAIVLDDSMSMRAPVSGGTQTRFDRAKHGALELLGSSREGDAVALVIAGAPPRVALAATTDLSAARVAIETATQSDRSTDLDGAVAMARALVAQLPQVDRRVVVLSDLADGHPEAPALGAGEGLPVWVPLPELRGDARDCGVLAADRDGSVARVTLGCGHGAASAGREVTLRAGDKVVSRGAAPSGAGGEVRLSIPADAPEKLSVRLEGSDAIAADDVASVVPAAAVPAIAVVVDATEEATATGGAPIVEQALSALHLDLATRPLPTVPDRVEDLAGFVGVIADDPPGFTPEQRKALGSFLEQGGEMLVGLGPRAAQAPLGATLEPALGHGVTWGATTSKGAVEAGASSELVDAARSLADLGAHARATLAAEDRKTFERLLSWDDGAPFVARRSSGRGGAWVVTLPFTVGTSDLTLRPGFLSLLDAWTNEARGRAVPLRIEAGHPWTFAATREVTVQGPAGPVTVVRDGDIARAVPAVLGDYQVTIAGKTQTRVAAPSLGEMDLRPRPAAPSAQSASLGDAHASVDISWAVALALLALVAAELALRVQRARRPEAVA